MGIGFGLDGVDFTHQTGDLTHKTGDLMGFDGDWMVIFHGDILGFFSKAGLAASWEIPTWNGGFVMVFFIRHVGLSEN